MQNSTSYIARNVGGNAGFERQIIIGGAMKRMVVDANISRCDQCYFLKVCGVWGRCKLMDKWVDVQCHKGVASWCPLPEAPQGTVEAKPAHPPTGQVQN